EQSEHHSEHDRVGGGHQGVLQPDQQVVAPGVHIDHRRPLLGGELVVRMELVQHEQGNGHHHDGAEDVHQQHPPPCSWSGCVEQDRLGAHWLSSRSAPCGASLRQVSFLVLPPRGLLAFICV